MFCKKCGHNNLVNSKYCSECGNKFNSDKNKRILYIFIVLTGIILLASLTYNFIQKTSTSLNKTISKPVVTTTQKETTEISNIVSEKEKEIRETPTMQVQTQITQAPRKIITEPTGIGGVSIPEYEGQPQYTLRDHHAEWTQALASRVGVSVSELNVSYFNDSTAAVYFRDKAVGVLKMDPYRRNATMYQGDYNGQLNY